MAGVSSGVAISSLRVFETVIIGYSLFDCVERELGKVTAVSQ